MQIINVMTKTLRTRSAKVRPASTAERAIGNDRNRSIKPLCRSSASADAGLDRSEHDRLREHSGHQVVDVVIDARDVNRAAEHVAEHQHEDDGLDRREHEHLWRAGHRDEVAPRDRERVLHGPTESAVARTLERRRRHGDRGHAAPRVRRRPGSAGVVGGTRLFGFVAGEREEDVVERRFAHGEGRRFEVRTVERAHDVEHDARRRRRPSARRSSASRPTSHSPMRASSRLGALRRLRHRRSRPRRSSAPSLAFSSADVPFGDHPAVIDHDDVVGEAVGLFEILRREQHGGAVARRVPR